MEINYDLSKIKITPLIDTLKMEDVSDSEYFSDKYSGFISNSRLGKLKSKGAQTFFDNKKEDFNQSLEFGTNLHALVLEPEFYELILSVNKPTAKAGLVADYIYREDGTTPTDDDIKVASIKCNYYKDKLTPNRIIEFREKAEPYWKQRFIYEQTHPKGSINRIYTDSKSQILLNACLDSINNNQGIQSLLKADGDSYFETAFTIDLQIEVPDYEPLVYHWKSKLDHFNIDLDTITVNDLKTTSRLASDFSNVIDYYSYNREIAAYSWLLKLYTKKYYNLENPKVKGNFLVISTIPDYVSSVYPMTRKHFETGFKEFAYLLKVVAYLNTVKGYKFNNGEK